MGGCSRWKGGAVVVGMPPPAGLPEGLQPSGSQTRSLIWEAVTRSLSHRLQRRLKMYVQGKSNRMLNPQARGEKTRFEIKAYIADAQGSVRAWNRGG